MKPDIMKKIRITQVKSAIDRPERQKKTLKALGLNKMNASRELQANDQILGMVRTVNHLLRVEEFEAEDTMQSNVALQEAQVETADRPADQPAFADADNTGATPEREEQAI